MGGLAIFEIDKLRVKYNLEVFVETGTFRGQAVDHAYRSGFKEIHSMEIVEKLANKAKEVFKKMVEIHVQQISSEDIPEIHIYQGSSKEVLSLILPAIKKNVLFWLDAHFPGIPPISQYPFKEAKNAGKYCDSLIKPLEDEIEIISKRTGSFKDVIIIDDLLLYEKFYEDGLWTPKSDLKNINFIDVFSETHNINICHSDQGYLFITPKS